MLSAARKLALLRRWREKHDVAARDELVEDYLPLVHATRKRFHVPPSLTDDAMSEGMQAVWRGIDLFDDTRGVRLDTYISRCVYVSMRGRLRAERRASMGPPTRRARHGIAGPLRVVVEDMDALDTEAAEDEPSLSDERAAIVRAAIESLDPRLQTFVRERFFGDESASGASVALSQGVSRERARQLLARACRKMREHLERIGFER